MPKKGIGILQAVPCFQRWSERSEKYAFVARTKRTTHNTELMCDRNLAVGFRVILWSRSEREYHKRMHNGGMEQTIHKTEVFQWWMPCIRVSLLSASLLMQVIVKCNTAAAATSALHLSVSCERGRQSEHQRLPHLWGQALLGRFASLRCCAC